MLDHITYKDRTLAILLRTSYQDEGVNFLTPEDFTQQLAYISHRQGHIIRPHMHNPVPREVLFTNEVLFIKSGKVRVDFYRDTQNYLESRILNPGDVILLAFGGHGFEMLEASEIIEVKQGPYVGEVDKTRFDSVSGEKVKLE